MKEDNRSKGLYLLSEIECLSVGSGAYYHIQHGLKELGKYYDIALFPITKQEKADDDNLLVKKTSRKAYSRKLALKSTIKWLYLLMSRNLDFLTWYRLVKKRRPEFLYERASFLNFKGLWIARILHIPHFYEVNGAFYLEAEAHFPKWLTKISKAFERRAYNGSDHSFFVGGISQSYHLAGSNYTDVQNGIETSFVARFAGKCAAANPDEPINVVFIGHAMKHHGLDVLTSASGMLDDPSHFNFHFVGTNYENLDLTFPASVKYVFHGKLDHDQIAQLLLNCEIGILPLTVSFSSAVKLFMYGAAKLLLVIPDVPNLRRIFSEDEVVFFKNGDASNLAQALNDVNRHRSVVQVKANKAYQKVSTKFLWSEIFREEAEIINRYLPV